MASSVLCQGQGYTNTVLENVTKKGAAVRLGTSYYLHHTNMNPYKVDQNSDEFQAVQICMKAYLAISCTRKHSCDLASILWDGG